MGALRSLVASFQNRVFAAWLALALILTVLASTASQAGLKTPSSGGVGAVLALAAQLRLADLRAATASSHDPNGRALLPRRLMHSGAILKAQAATPVTTPIPGAVQTYDVFNPPPAFRPLIGYDNGGGAIGNNPQNPPLYVGSLAPTNLTPVWSQDETFLVYSSNRTVTGSVATDGRFHLWAISVNGGEAYQITTSTGPAGGGEFFPALNSSNNTEIAFSSDAQTPGVQNLYAIQFSFAAVVAGTPGNISDPTFVVSPTNTAGTGFDQVERPTISPTNSNLIVFSAHSTTGTNAGHNHLYFLNLTTGGFDANNRSLPAKLTDGQADDIDPAYSNDGQYLAFASTASRVDAQTAPNNTFSSNPNTSQSITTITAGTTSGSNRSLFLLSGGAGASGTGAAGFGTPPASLQSVHGRITQTGTDDYGPAWSYNNPNQYTNSGIGFEYLAFARGAAQTSPHDIYYLQTVRGVNSQGETGRSYEASTAPVAGGATLYQVAAGSNGYRTYTGDNAANGLPFFFGGALGTNTATVDTTNDPTAPPGLYSTFRLGGAAVGAAPNIAPADQFTYTLPNLTPGSVYTVRLHFADPTDAVAGKRVFKVAIPYQYPNNNNLTQSSQTVDIAAAAGAANKAYVLTLPNIIATDYFPGFGNTANPTTRGRIQIIFSKSPGSTDEPLVNGIEVLSNVPGLPAGGGTTNSAFSGFGGYAGTSQPGAPAYFNAAGLSATSIGLTWQPVSGAVSYNLYRTPTGSGTSENRPNNGGSGLEGNVPYLTGITGTPVNGPGGTLLSFTDPDTTIRTGSQYFYQITAVVLQSITPETSSGSNTAVKVVTENNAPSTTNTYDDVYPSWSPFRSIFSIAYSSNRSVSYNDPVSGVPSETAISLPRGQTTTSYSVGSAYAGVLISQVLNLDPPTLLRFSSTETVHVQPGNTADPVNGTPTKFGLVTGGQAITLTVRLSNREAGIDDNNVYIQIKDPDSKYQDSQRMEHKVFAKDPGYDFQSNQPGSDLSTYSSNFYLGINGPGFGLGGGNRFFRNILDTWPTYGVGGPEFPRGSFGGFWNGTNTHIYVGKTGGGNNSLTGTDARQNPPVQYQFAGDNPNLFIPWGPEYECQFLNAQYGGPDSVLTDYGTPYYLAGVDDQQAFSGVFNAPRPEWLHLTKVAAASQDNKGGVLYTATWTTPTSGSDFYLDVIAYDLAVFPTLPANTSNYQGGSVNWRIYDNVGGFSTNQSIGNNDILVVSDYALGQKFAGTTFNGSNGNLNLVPKLYGAESYFTDVDVNVLPDTVYAGYPTFLDGNQADWSFGPYLQKFGTGVGAYSALFSVAPADVNAGPNAGWHWLNGLGVGSYSDRFTSSYNQGSTVDGVSYDNSQKYSIWRILSRGPVPQQTLNSYLPTKQPEPAVVDLQGATAYHNVKAATILDAHRCIIWVSPYTGDLLTDPGSLDDPGSFNVPNQPDRQSTQTILRSFVQNGGRLFISGQDVGSGLTSGSAGSNSAGGFLSDVLNATLASANGGTSTLTGGQNRITGDPGYDGLIRGYYPEIVGTYPDPLGFRSDYIAGIGPVYPYQDNLVLGSSGQSDGSLDQRLTPLTLGNQANLLGQIDSITPANGATPVMTYGANGPVAMVIHDDPYGLPKAGATPGALPNGGTGSRVVYGGFGLEAMSNDVYAPEGGDPAFPLSVAPAAPRNPRANILHNIVTYLRTGSISGLITQTAGTGAGAGQGVPSATVYLVPASGNAPPTRATFSATTDPAGLFTIYGVEPGVYTLVAYKAGYSRAASNAGVTFTVEGDTNVRGASLSIGPLPPGNIAGAVHDSSSPANLINGATVTFLSQDNSITRTITTVNGSVTSNPAENYFLASVPVTTYTATASSPTNPQGLPEYTAATAPDAPPAGSPAGTPDYSQGVTVQPNTTVQPVNFTLTPIPATIKGTVTNAATGLPVAGASVFITTSAGQSLGHVVSAVDGTYTLPNVPAAAAPTATGYTLTATAPGFAASAPLTESVFLGSVLTGQNFSLSPIPPGSIKVTVAYSTGGPVAGAIVTYTAPGGTAQTTTTGADGTVVIPNVPPATYSVTAVGPNNANGKPTTQPAAAQNVTVTSGQQATATFAVVPIPPSFSGKVTSSAASTPASTALANATVTVTGTDASGAAITPITIKTDKNGAYTTGPLAPGTYTLTATLAGFAPTAIGPTTVQLGDVLTGQNFVLASVAPGSITGIVSDNNGKPVVGAVVTFNSTDGTVSNLTATTVAGGTYVIPPPPATAGNVPASTYTGTAVGPNNANGKPEYGAGNTQTVTVPAGGSGTANFTLPANLASVSGTVTDVQTSGAVAGATVTLTDASGATVGTQTTGAGGSFAFTGILATQTAQSYTLTVAKTGYTTAAVSVMLALGDAVTQNVPLNEQAALYGLVIDGSPDMASPVLAGVTITVKDAGGNTVATVPTPVTTSATAATGADGKPENYTATLLPGTYTVTASKGSYTSQTSAVVTLTNAAPVRVNFALVSSIGTLGGLVTDQNGTGLVSGATVTAVLTGTTTGISFTTAATATSGPDGSPLNYSGQLPQGTYSVTVTKGSRTSAAKTVTVAGGAFTRLDFTAATGLPALHTFAAGFQFVSTPYDYSSLGFDGLFGPLNTAPAGTTPNGNRSHVAVWNPLTGAYALDPNAPADSLRLGVGYWVYLKNAVPVTQQGATPTAATVSVSLGMGWNQIGVPNPSAAGIPVASLAFDNGAGGTISFSQASSAQYNLVTHPLYSYAGGGYQTVSSSGVLMPWNAYWIYVNAPATLEIPTR